MKKGVKNFCSSDNSTSTLNQQHEDDQRQPTLEEMILQLELEEEIARQEKEKLNRYNKVNVLRGRMSCVSNSDILRSARNALNQYPRFSLDGKDAMYRSSFRNLEGNGRKSVGCDYEDYNTHLGPKFEKRTSFCMPKNCYSSARENISNNNNVIWCKPGIVAKLMGLEAMPVVATARRKVVCDGKMKCCSVARRQNLRRRAERHEIERRIVMENVRINEAAATAAGRRSSGAAGGGGKIIGSCSKTSAGNQYCVLKPAVPAVDDDDLHPQNNNLVGGGWPTRRFR